ncbi:unnamed protein product [Cylindrotheca closterium]|uniref:Uncharacterized protein n=1 Tax=Cylindrotheca closterium TaxID=2856 RepID=A0AAD2CVA1_9STRA|nr:unnamed protein product [Cylindrotheca closterium]
MFPATSFTPTRNGVIPATHQQRPQQEKPKVLQMALDASLLTDLSTAYSMLLQDHYYPTQSLTGGICSFMGDAVAQTVDRNDNEDSYDSKRGAVYFCKGLGGGILWSCWFESVDPIANQLTSALLLGQSSSPSVEQATRTAVCILLEQFFVSPLFFSIWDIPLPALLQGSPPYQMPAQIQEKLPPLLVANAKVWTPVNLITYNIPPEYRVLFSSSADIFWQAINAAITSREIQMTDVATAGMATTQLQSELVKSNTAPAESSSVR